MQVGIAQPDVLQNLTSFDVRGTGTLHFQNFHVCCHPIDYYPVIDFALTQDWQTITFDPAATGFFFQVSAASAFDIDNIAFGSNEPAPPADPVPEPATWAMMLLGFGALGIRGRARSRTISRFA